MVVRHKIEKLELQEYSCMRASAGARQDCRVVDMNTVLVTGHAAVIIIMTRISQLQYSPSICQR